MKAKKTVIFSVALSLVLILLAYNVMIENVDPAIQSLKTGYEGDDSIFVDSENLNTDSDVEAFSSRNLIEDEFSRHLSFEALSLQSGGNKSLALNLESEGGASVSIKVDGGTVTFEVEASGSGVLDAELEAENYLVEASVDKKTPETLSGSGHLEVFYEFLRSLIFDGELND